MRMPWLLRGYAAVFYAFLYAPILVMVIVVALVNVGGVALSLDRGNRGETGPTPVDVTKVRVAKRFIPAGTPVEHLSKLLTT